MFEEYLEDAFDFYAIGKDYLESNNERKARQYFRASTFYTSGSLEGFVNYLIDTFKNNSTFDTYELAFLSDENIFFDSSKLKLKSKIEYHRIEDKIKFLLIKFKVDYDFKTELSWSRLCSFKEFRNKLVHPNENNEEIDIHKFKQELEFGISSIIEIMDILTFKLFDKHLRRKILDLKPI